MAETIATGFVTVGGVYLLVGVLFALAFVTRGVNRLEPSAADGSWGFRVLIFPGTVALWPLLARRWLRAAGQQPEERNAHRDAANQGAKK